ncbi:PREDICTED: dnaJ homolog subfamily C member 21 [Bactrocera latifrons]|uniref:dnaJ homolog subfamily C member 21 n=1 Tax=Bactrocera latifrons TaxID=174628 RepID=UPI0008DE7FA7|nr:PREDICTED: dnaJ homolog subfamily C member 21 [Bactrocera latifrons]
MKCYYEELGVARDATDGDIKSAYRKLALRWHPDKNLNALDEAKERFQLIQQAYEVLSDPQERAWYDNHRDQILRGKNSNYTENCLDVFEYFTSSCYRGFEDDEKGFYAVYREVFEKLAAEDAEFMDDDSEIENIPSFGDSKSNYEEVVAPFYAYWQSYCTKKSYTWLCPYDVKDIRDRRILREVEKEMKKVVQKARKERNDEVRNLVSFVRKRDKRVQAYKKVLEERAELNRKKQEQNRLEQIRKRQREMEEMRQNQKQSGQNNDEYETQLKQLAQDYGDSSDEEESETEDQEEGINEDVVLESVNEQLYIDDLYCVACNKAFKNQNAYANHETSKKHREALERMKLEMQAEEEAFLNSNDSDSLELEDSEIEELDDDYSIDWFEDISDERDLSGNVQEELKSSKEKLLGNSKSKKNKNTRKNIKNNKSLPQTTCDDDEETLPSDFLTQAKLESDEEDWNNRSKKSARKNKKQGKKAVVEEKETNSLKVEAEIIEKANARVATVESDEPLPQLLPKTKETSASIKVKENTDSSATSHVCVTCHANFQSKNKLFAHLKITNHGVYIPKTKTQVSATAPDGKNKKNKGKRK